MGLINTILLLLILAFFAVPLLKQYSLERGRRYAIAALGKARKSKVITLIHRLEFPFMQVLPFIRFITIDDSEKILSAIRETESDKPIDIILHTPGGVVIASQQIAMALARHRGKVTVHIPHYAMSGGTMIALAGDAINIDENAVMGTLDPQLQVQYSASSLLRVVEDKPIENIEDKTLILADVARKAMSQIHDSIQEILQARGVTKKKSRDIAKKLTSGETTHDYPLTPEEARNIGLPINTDIPEQIHQLMRFYRQPRKRSSGTDHS